MGVLTQTVGRVGWSDILLMLIVMAVAIASVVLVRFIFRKSNGKKTTSDLLADVKKDL